MSLTFVGCISKNIILWSAQLSSSPHVHPPVFWASMFLISVRSIQLRPLVVSNVGISVTSFIMRRSLVIINSSNAFPLVFVHVSNHSLLSMASTNPSPFVSCNIFSIVSKSLSISRSVGRYRTWVPHVWFPLVLCPRVRPGWWQLRQLRCC
jgi:hypothetical protein